MNLFRRLNAGEAATHRCETYRQARLPVRAFTAKKTPALFAK